MALLDFVTPTGDWYARHPMTSAALGMILSFWIAGLLLEGWFKDREARKLERISTVAYRSLAQYANDAGRTLLGLLNGADLFVLGVPGATRGSVAKGRELLERNGVSSSFEEPSGSWRPADVNGLKGALFTMLRDDEFSEDLYRTVACARRRVQDATAVWAPVMLTSPTLAKDLGRYRELSDSLELLQEHLRPAVSAGRRNPHVISDDWLHTVTGCFWSTIVVYEGVRDEFAERASLPSDVVFAGRRRGQRPSLRDDIAADPTEEGVVPTPEPVARTSTRG